MSLSVFILILALLVVSPAAGMPAGKCTLGNKPIEVELFGKEVQATFGCGRGGSSVRRSVRIEPWAVIFRPFIGGNFNDNTSSVCPEEISVVYVRGKRVPMLYYRKALFAVSSKGVDCSKIPIRKIVAWGKDRKEFKKRLNDMVTAIKDIREFSVFLDCFDTTSKITRAGLKSRIEHDRIATAAINLINGVAFNTFLCL